MSDAKYYLQLRDKLSEEKRPEIMKLGYNVACGIGLLEEKLCLAVRLQPLRGSPDPIDDDLFTRIKNDLENYLQNIDKNVPIDIQYTGRIVAQ